MSHVVSCMKSTLCIPLTSQNIFNTTATFNKRFQWYFVKDNLNFNFKVSSPKIGLCRSSLLDFSFNFSASNFLPDHAKVTSAAPLRHDKTKPTAFTRHPRKGWKTRCKNSNHDFARFLPIIFLEWNLLFH